jgi:RTX calcium-binding nonapeptide repeat (4 copies)
MNKKLIFTGVCLILGSFTLTDSVWAQPAAPRGPNFQSVKQCPQSVIAHAHVRLTAQFPNFRFSDNFTPDDPSDDSYQVCRNANFTVCQLPVLATNGSGLIIIGSNGPNKIQGTPYDDTICGINGDDTINGKEGDDTIYGNNGSDDLSGGLGDDLIYGGNGNDTLFGYDEELNGLFDTDSDILSGGNGNDQLFGGPDADSLWGENGKDHLDGGDGVDAIDGGRGKDSCADLNDACASATNI